MRLYLIGYMGCGKSTIGRKVAKAVGVQFIDTDALVEQKEGALIADIIHFEGEEYFRKVERRALDETATENDAIISTGGGLPVWRDNMDVIHSLGKSVYIKRSPENILSRLSPHGRYKRPMLRGLNDEEALSFMRTHMAGREAVYSQADEVIEADSLSDEEIIARVLSILEQ